ncbi:MAG: sugar phosphate isomerase/epimerase [Candidatus Hydrogenedentes bacterium]|nr:sugar phosphate isomerase/epimerase [Candidatus Hydrogenedentota bacterium]
MLRAGLVSVVFRTMAASDVVKVAAQGGAEGIEWSSENHVPVGKKKLAGQVGQLTRDAGIEVAAYGSYHRLGCERTSPTKFSDILDTAVALGAPMIRVWAGNTGSRTAREYVWREVTEETQRAADLAKTANVSIAFEFQANTLNDTPESSLRLLAAIARDNVYTYWQPDGRLMPDEQMEGLQQLYDRLSNIHVFHWQKGRRMPLSEGEKDWRRYFHHLARSRRSHWALIEYVQDDLPAKYVKDAETLRLIIAGATST